MDTGEFNARGNPVMDLHPIQGGVEILLVASCYRNRDTLWLVSRLYFTFSLGKDRSYYVQQQLGSGAFAKVYLARTRAPDVDVDPEDVETDETCIVLKVSFVF